MATTMTKEQKALFLEDVLVCMEESNFLVDLYNDIKLEEENYKIRDLQTFKKLLIDNGFKVDIKNVSQYHGNRAVVSIQ